MENVQVGDWLVSKTNTYYKNEGDIIQVKSVGFNEIAYIPTKNFTYKSKV